ncbi:hypothetical protein I6G82_00055 (plasmid) [Lysinibacillus macroides]|uniref:hypothetical protein n=1 Tax=Lysinibacillus macroides TaxID=33935 RepID=UPI001934EBC9|nr:hypothetical protein I6G82_00055 [Lysinibacillus macroides]
MSEQAWAPIILEAANSYISKRLEALPDEETSFSFERNEIENHLVSVLKEAPRGAIVGALNRFLKVENGIERIKRGTYMAHSSKSPMRISKDILKESIDYLQQQILGVTTHEGTGLTEMDIEMIEGISLAIKQLKSALIEIEKIEQLD